MSWAMINGWREDFNEGPYDYLAVRDGWEIFQGNFGDKFKVTAPNQEFQLFTTEKLAKEHAYENGCSKPREDEI